MRREEGEEKKRLISILRSGSLSSIVSCMYERMVSAEGARMRDQSRGFVTMMSENVDKERRKRKTGQTIIERTFSFHLDRRVSGHDHNLARKTGV